MQVWSATTRSHIFTALNSPQSGEVLNVGWLVDDKRIRVGYADGSIEELDATTGNVSTYLNQAPSLHQIPSERFVSALTWTLDGTCIAFGSDDLRVLVYDTVKDDSFVCSVPAAPIEALGTSSGKSNRDAVQTITRSPDNKRIASAKNDTMVQMWDVATGNHIFTWRVRFVIAAVTWSPDNSRIALGFFDGLVQVWDVATGNIACTYRDHIGPAWAVAWSPDTKRIASGGVVNLASSRDDRRPEHIWDAMNGDNVICIYRGARPMG